MTVVDEGVGLARLVTTDLAVVGAGPAGLAGAVTAADAGCSVTLVDLAERPGGQYWRHSPDALGGGPTPFHHHWAAFSRLRARLDHHQGTGRITYLPSHAVWHVEGGESFTLRTVSGERRPVSGSVHARAMLIATGAHDRHVPFSGWTLPGVMAVGGAQALLKGNLVSPGRRVVVAGTGPFLLSAADGLLAAGAQVVAVVEANSLRGYMTSPSVVAGAGGKLVEALGYSARMARHRVPYLPRHAVVEARGAERVKEVTVAAVDTDWRPRPGTRRSIACDTLAVGFGFVPQLELLLGLGCQTRLEPGNVLVVAVDEEQQTTVTGVFAAGEPTGVGGADLAIVEGSLAGDAAARLLGGEPGLARRASSRLRRRRARMRAFARLLAEAHPVPDGWREWCEGSTTVCRCEEVSVDEVTLAVALGAGDTRTLKLLARPGMGRCQGRICGPAVAALCARANHRPVSAGDLEVLGHRPVAQPIPLGLLAEEQE